MPERKGYHLKKRGRIWTVWFRHRPPGARTKKQYLRSTGLTAKPAHRIIEDSVHRWKTEIDLDASAAPAPAWTPDGTVPPAHFFRLRNQRSSNSVESGRLGTFARVLHFLSSKT